MIRKFFLTLCIFFISINFAAAKIDVVYPKVKHTTINASSTFFIGNTEEGSSFSINSKNVKLWNNNFFVEVVPLEYGKNKITLESIKNGKKEEITYIIKRNKLSEIGKEPEFRPKNTDETLYTKTIKDKAVVRQKATSKSNRIVDLPKNIILYLDGKKGEYYKIAEQGKTEFWIHEKNIQHPVNLSQEMKAKLKNQKTYSDELYNYHKFYLSHPVMYTTLQRGNSIELTLYGVQSEGNNNHNYVHTFNLEQPILGYEGYYEENNFIFKTRKVPNNINPLTPLKNITIFVDAGHGGSEKGAIGPTRVNEKDINLAISNYLVDLLKSSGANIITSRTQDAKVDLYDRVDFAKNNNALISISIHNNSLPNGKNPYEKHGCEVHYYNENAKKLAEIINTNLSLDLNLKNGGIHKSSLALNRSTNPISVLVEVAYMINPNEYILLQNPQFQKDVANSIKKSIEKYINSFTSP